MGNKNTCCCVFIEFCADKMAVGIDINADGSTDEKRLVTLRGIVERCEAIHDLALIYIIYGAKCRPDITLAMHSRSEKFALCNTSLDATMLCLHRAGLLTHGMRTMASRNFSNAHSATALATTARVLRACGLSGFPIEMFGPSKLDPEWVRPVLVTVEARGVAEPVTFSLDAVEDAEKALERMARLPGDTVFIVSVWFDAVPGGPVRRNVFFFDDPVLLAQIDRVIVGARGRLRRASWIPLPDVYPIHFVTNACGPNVERLLRDRAMTLAITMGGWFASLTSDEKNTTTQK